MDNSVLQRVRDFIRYNGLSKSSFAKSIGMEQTTVNNQLIGKRSISIDLIINTLNSYREISAEWLMRGEGEMLKSVSQSVGNINNSTAVVNNGNGNKIRNNDTSCIIGVHREYLSLLKAKDEQIERLTKVIEQLTSKL